MKKEDIQKLIELEERRRENMSDRELLVRIDERVIGMVARQDNHGDRLLRIELSIVGALISVVGGFLAASRDAIFSHLGAKWHP